VGPVLIRQRGVRIAGVAVLVDRQRRPVAQPGRGYDAGGKR
jgi:hypothetical protein